MNGRTIALKTEQKDGAFLGAGHIIILSAPSGCGKSTIADELVERNAGWVRSISYTTRLPRIGEENGRDYYFIGEPEFKKMIEEDAFFEWENFFGSYYGTPKKNVEEDARLGKHVLLAIDVKGAKRIMKKLPALSIFIKPPSDIELERRLRQRASNSEADIQSRLERAKMEMDEAHHYGHVVVNDSLLRVVEEIEGIVKSI